MNKQVLRILEITVIYMSDVSTTLTSCVLGGLEEDKAP